MTYPPDDPQIAAELRFLRAQLPAGVGIFVGGRAASSYLPLLEQIGAVYLTGASDIIEVLGEYRGQAKAG